MAAIKFRAQEYANNLRSIVDDVRAQGITSIRKIAEELNQRGVVGAKLHSKAFGQDRHLSLGRFATAAEAIHYAVEELSTGRSLSAWMLVGDERFNKNEINRLYEDDDYPMRTPLSSERGNAAE